ncbi:MAG: adenylate/guanylate cyclase domain-containing protein, partial [Bacteroidia bacterium]|nr:adenylate/guanylate cyclase domain-containing protein [Bacteroidia bacterium]
MSENTSSTRRLAAILFADIQGYTALMQKDEKKASILLRRFQEQLKKGVNENNGEIVNFYGDGALCLFDFPKAAIHCAIEMQRIFTNNPHVPVRIGIHTGSVVQEGEKVFGHSVNIASRIESIGVPGSILFSEKVRDDIRNHQEFQITSLGNFQFKNVDEPLSVYAISNQGIIVPKKSEIHGKLRPKSPTTPWWILAAIAFLIAAYFMIPLLS